MAGAVVVAAVPTLAFALLLRLWFALASAHALSGVRGRGRGHRLQDAARLHKLEVDAVTLEGLQREKRSG